MTIRKDIHITEKGAAQAKQKLDGVDRSLKGVDAGLKRAAMSAIGFAGAFVGVAGVTHALGQSIKLFGEQERVEKKLRTSLGKTSYALLEQASALQKTTVYGDEATIAQMAFLASLDMSEEQIAKIVPVAMDLAAATGMSLESAVRNTAKTFSGLTGELGELVPQLRGLTAEALKAGEAVDVMAELFGGQAAAEAATTMGAWEQAMNALGDAGEAVGKVLAPAVKYLSGEIKEAAEGWQELMTGMADPIEFAFVGPTFDGLRPPPPIPITFEVDDEDPLYGISEMAPIETEVLISFPEISEVDNTFKRIIEGHGLYYDEVLTMGQTQAERETELLENKKALLQEAGYTDIQLAEYVASERERIATEEANRTKLLEDQKLQYKLRSLSSLTGGLAQLNAASKGSAVATKRLMQAQAIVDTYAGANRALATGVPPFSYIMAAGTIAAGLANVAQIEAQRFALGGDFTTSGPQVIMVGDNPGGRERVQVTPISSPNVNGPQSGDTIHINFNAPVTDEQFVRDVVVPEIDRVIRLRSA